MGRNGGCRSGRVLGRSSIMLMLMLQTSPFYSNSAHTHKRNHRLGLVSVEKLSASKHPPHELMRASTIASVLVAFGLSFSFPQQIIPALCAFVPICCYFVWAELSFRQHPYVEGTVAFLAGILLSSLAILLVSFRGTLGILVASGALVRAGLLIRQRSDPTRPILLAGFAVALRWTEPSWALHFGQDNTSSASELGQPVTILPPPPLPPPVSAPRWCASECLHRAFTGGTIIVNNSIEPRSKFGTSAARTYVMLPSFLLYSLVPCNMALLLSDVASTLVLVSSPLPFYLVGRAYPSLVRAVVRAVCIGRSRVCSPSVLGRSILRSMYSSA